MDAIKGSRESQLHCIGTQVQRWPKELLQCPLHSGFAIAELLCPSGVRRYLHKSGAVGTDYWQTVPRPWIIHPKRLLKGLKHYLITVCWQMHCFLGCDSG